MLNNLKRRALTLLLSLAMIITYMPTSMIAYAVDGDEDQTQVEQQVDADKPAEEAASEEVKSEDVKTEEAASEEKTEDVTSPEDKASEEAAKPADEESKEDAKAEAEDEAKDEFSKGELKAENGRYKAIVSYGADAEIPDGAKLVLTEFGETDKEFKDAKEALVADEDGNSAFSQATEEEQEELGMAAFDLTIYDKDGKVVEPKGEVAVNFELKELPEGVDAAALAESMEIQHLNESSGDVVVEKIATVDSQEARNDKAVGEIAVNESKETAKVETAVDAFSTFTITWRNNNTYRATVHYVDESGNELTIANPANTHPNIDNNDSSPAYLIYDIDGYEYSHTYKNSDTNANRIKPILERGHNYDNRWYSTNSNGTSASWTELSNNDNIYVVYKKKPAVTTGGTPKIDQDEVWPDEEEPARKPQFGKSSTNNGNGTNTVSLTISAAEKPETKTTPADVIVIFDRSRSMITNNLNGQTRLARAKTATNKMADTLLNGDNHDVRMALIQFSTDAELVQGFTSDYDTFEGKVNDLTGDGGTNWEKALKIANEMEVRQDAATFVVFVTDGDPTFRISRGDVTNGNLDMYSAQEHQFYRNNFVFGTGSSDQYNRNFNYAVPQVANIANAKKNFYAIGISNDVTKVQNLTTQGGVAADHAFIASDNDAMERAFKSITESIKSTLGFGDVEITDGITALSHTEMAVMQEVDPNSFKYYRYGGENNKYGNGYANKTEWTTRATDGCAAATYDKTKGTVNWNMGESFQLEDGVTYVVEFEVWPSQDAYDLVADLNNGLIDYDTLDAAKKAQIVEVTAPTPTTTGTYALKTNTNEVKATYSQTSESGDTVTVTGDENLLAEYHEGTLQNMALDSNFIKVKKEWNNELDSHVEDGVTLSVTKDGVVYLDDVDVNDGNNWTSEDQYISAGFITTTSDGRYNVREHGHDYTVTEPKEYSYYWDLKADIYRPMVVNGKLHVMIKTNSPTGTEGRDYFVIDGNKYQVKDGQTTLTATNDRRSRLDVTKSVTGNNAPDEPFDFTMKVVNSRAATGTATDTDSDYYVWFSIFDTKANAIVTDPDAASATTGMRWQLNDAPEHGTVVTTKPDAADFNGYFCVPSGTNINVHMKDGYSLRFLNLPTGSTYEITESDVMPEDGFSFVSVVGTREYTDKNKQPQTEQNVGTISGQKISGTISEANSTYKAAYTNKWETTDVKVKKVDEKNAALDGAVFKLERSKDKGATWTTAVDSFSPSGNDNPYDLGNLGTGLYKMTETTAPTGYVKADTVYFLVSKTTDGFIVELADESGESVDSVDGVSIALADGAYTITVEDPRERGNLKVTKTVVSKLNADKNKDFSFTVTLSDKTINETFGTGANAVTFTNGVATFTLKGGESKTIEGLPTGITYTVTEATATGFNTTKTGDTGTITTTESTAAFTNTRETGDLEVTKSVVSDLAADKTKDFNFTVTLSDTSISGTFGDMTFTNGIATFTLKDGGKKTATGLPTTVGYTVTEADEGGFTTTKTGDTGTITVAKKTAAFTNTRDTGDLDVTKTVVSSTNADKQKDFTFTVTLSDTTINKTYGTGADAVTFTNGVATFTLKHGQTKSITGLPTSVGYTVAEATASGFVTTKTGETGTISTQKATAAFTNTRDEGGLVVSKTVVSDVNADKTKDFSFTVTLSDTSINETYGTGANAVTFTNGVATFTLKDGESKNISGLPKGITYTVTEETDDNFTTTKTGETGTISDTASTAAFTNTRKTGKVTISKTVVSDAAADKELTFTFTITLVNGEQKISGTYSEVTFDAEGKGTVSLKGGEKKTIDGLPIGTSYTVTEAAVEGFVTTQTGDTGTISETESKADFTNTRETGDLEVTKTVVSSTAADKTKLFSFTVTLSDNTINGEYGNMTFANGVATFELKDSENKKATGLPTGVTYTVTEETADGFVTTKTGDTGTISTDGSTAAFTNTRSEGGLTVKKTVVSDVNADKTKDFTFTITLSDKTINETYSGVEFKAGVATLKLKHDQSKTIEGLPTGITYTVTEEVDNDFVTTKTGDTGTISETAATAAFTNTRKTGKVTISKTVVSDRAADADQKFEFTITLVNGEQKISGKYSDVDFDEEGKATIELKGGESKSIEGLPIGTEYTVTEAAVAGFDTSKTGDTGTISTTESKADFTNTRQKGDLEVDKTVISDAAADANKEFTFTVTLGDTSISGTYGDMTFTNGVATFTLKGGEKKAATGLPTDVTYTVAETEDGGFTTTPAQPATGTIKTTKSTASFTNTRKTGDLVVTKTVVSSTRADKQKDFSFTVTLSDTTISGEYGDMTFENGIASFTLKDGEEAKAEGLPTSITYTVVEADAAGFVTTKTGDEGTISETESTAAFTNSRDEGGLVVSKSVVSDVDADKTKDFEFTVTLSDTTINETYGEDANAVTFENGVATFTLKDGETKNINGLPKGITYTVVETADDNFTTVSTGETGTITATAATAAFTNTRKTGKVTISKTVVSDAAADKDQIFTFTITLVNGEQKISGTYSEVTFGENGEGTITLKGGEKKTIEGLPVGTTYTVVEATATGFDTTQTGDSGTISETESKADFTNTRQTGDLELSKELISDLAADADQEFTFTITLSDTTISKTYSNVEFKNGVATVKLKGGEKKLIQGLPTGVTYTITEAEVEGFELTSKTGDTGTISTTKSEASFTNTRETGSLKLSKELISERTADADQVFTFTVTLTGAAISGTYGGMVFENGVATVTLKGGENATATGLPTDATYTITEASATGFKLTGKTGDTGTISTTMSEAVFTNTRETGDLELSKVLISDLAADADQDFTFTVTLTGAPITGDYGDMTFANGVATVTLKGGEKATAVGLPTDVAYTITEASVDGIVNTGKTGDTGTISTTLSKAEFTNTRETGDLEVKKTVVSEMAADKNVEFDFTVTLSDTTISGSYGDMTFTDGVATFKLKDGQSKKAEGLPTTVEYTVEEAESSGFSTTKTGDTGVISTEAAGLAEFTNTAKQTSVTVNKIWKDNEDKEGLRPDGITVHLIATIDNKPVTLPEGIVTVQTLTKENADPADPDKWTYTWENLPLKQGGVTINYSVTEEDVEGYEKAIVIGPAEETADGSQIYTVQITNTLYDVEYVADTPELTITKQDQDGKALEGVIFTLTNPENGEKIEVKTGSNGIATLEIPQNDKWLPVDERVAGKTAYTYELTETPITGYEEIGPWTIDVGLKVNPDGQVYKYTLKVKPDTEAKYWERFIDWIINELSGEPADAYTWDGDNLALKVTNKAAKQAIEVTKTYDGLDALPEGFAIDVEYIAYGTAADEEGNIATTTKTLTVADATVEGKKLTWKIDDVRFGSSVVATEKNYEEHGYAVESTFSTKIKGSDATDPAEGTEATIAKVPAGEEEGEVVGNIDFVNTYKYRDILLKKDIKTYLDHQEQEGASFVFHVEGYNEAGELILDTSAGIDLSAPEEGKNLLEKISTDVVKITVTEVYAGNYKPVKGTVTTTEIKVDEDNPLRSYFEVSFENTFEDDYRNKTGITNKYKKNADGTTSKADSGDTQGGTSDTGQGDTQGGTTQE